MKRLFAILALSAALLRCTPAAEQIPPTAVSDSAELVQAEAARPPDSASDRNQLGRFALPPQGGERAKDDSYERRDRSAQPPARSLEAERGSRPTHDTAPQPQESTKKKSDLARSEPASAAPFSGSRSGAGAVAERMMRPDPAPQPEDRPGLGTSWGEARYSSVSEVPFEREDSRPNYAATIHYNDQHGAGALAGRGGASTYPSNASVGLGSALTLSLRDEYGRTLSAYRGSGRTVAIGENGQRYVIVVRNNTNERFEIVLSVDGLDVLDGRHAGYGKRGYLIDAYGTIEIEGFRQSQDAVASFRFGAVGESYAAQTGSARNVGVIGAAAFGERGYTARLRAYQERVYAQRLNNIETARRETADPFPNKYALPPLLLAH